MNEWIFCYKKNLLYTLPAAVSNVGSQSLMCINCFETLLVLLRKGLQIAAVPLTPPSQGLSFN